MAKKGSGDIQCSQYRMVSVRNDFCGVLIGKINTTLIHTVCIQLFSIMIRLSAKINEY